MAAAGLGMSLYSAFSGSSDKKKAAEQAKKIGELQSAELLRRADEEQRLGIEQQKSMLDQQARRAELIKSMYSKSGLLLTGTPGMALSEQGEVDAYNLNETRLASESRVKSMRKGAELATLGASNLVTAYDQQGNNAMLSGVFGAIGGATQMYGSLSNWGGGKNTYAQDQANMMDLTGGKSGTTTWIDDFLKNWK